LNAAYRGFLNIRCFGCFSEQYGSVLIQIFNTGPEPIAIREVQSRFECIGIEDPVLLIDDVLVAPPDDAGGHTAGLQDQIMVNGCCRPERIQARFMSLPMIDSPDGKLTRPVS